MSYFAGPGGSDSVNRSLHRERPVVDGVDDYPWDDDQRSLVSGAVTAHFGDLTARAVRFIEASQAVVGCVAWLTEPRLLKALEARPVSLVVQKEDFLRPDSTTTTDWRAKLRESYSKLNNDFTRYPFPPPLSSASSLSNPELDGVRCVGNHNSTKTPAMPRMHHKFLVRLEIKEVDQWNTELIPVAVWTGSFNFSKNAGYSFENAVEIRDTEIAMSYLEEFARVMVLSEPLDWESPWVYPEWRIGT
jgi:hypothetical protein